MCSAWQDALVGQLGDLLDLGAESLGGIPQKLHEVAILVEIDPDPSNNKNKKKTDVVIPTSTLPPSKLIDFIQSDLPRSSSCIQFTENRSLEDVCWRFVSNQEG